MKTDVYTIITNRILAQLEQGVVPWRQPWRCFADGSRPANLRSRRDYRGINLFLLGCAPYSSRWWVTYKQARELGGTVRAGEHGSPVVLWKRDTTTEPDPVEDSPSRTRLLVRYFTLFNTEQCDGVTTPASQPPPPFDSIPAAAAIVETMPQRPTILHGGDRACYSPREDIVRMPHPGAFLSPPLYYSTLFHELGHSTLAEHRLNRQHRPGRDAYAKEELVAELTACLLCGVVGLEPIKVEGIGPNHELNILTDSAAYLAHWLGVLRADNRLILTAAQQAQKAADYILNRSAVEEQPAEPTAA